MPYHNSFSAVVSKLSGVKQKPVHRFGVFLSSILVAMVLPQALSGQSGAYSVSQLGHNVGTASYRFASTPEGIESSSTVRVSMKGLEYAFSKTEQLSREYEFRQVQLSATVNSSAVSVTGTSESGQIVLNVSANGQTSTARLAAQQTVVFLPDFDPGALQTLVNLAVAHNNRGLYAIFPKQTGNQPATINAVQLATYPDEQGTLNGRTITVHHLVATMAETSTDLFIGPENQLLQAELPQAGFALIGSGFLLKPPAKAGAAPPPPTQPPPTQ